MIIQKSLPQDRTYTYSNEGYKIRQIETGKIYYDAIDQPNIHHTYEETDQLINDDDIDPEVILNILLGGEQL